MKPLSDQTRSIVLKMQQGELTEYYLYQKISKHVKKEKDREILEHLSEEEKIHAQMWKGYTGVEVRPKRFKIFWYGLISRVFGYTFALKRMETGEKIAQSTYEILAKEIPEAKQVEEDEERHEKELLALLDEERLRYVGSMVLGLNDALVELTGTLAGMTFALQRTDLVALSGLITGISATLSMASSEYLSARTEGRSDAFKSCIYTGIAYLITVALLVLPYLLVPAHLYGVALLVMLVVVVLIILVFNYYVSVAQDYSFKKRFGEMAAISLGVAALSFLVGLAVKHFLGIDV